MTGVASSGAAGSAALGGVGLASLALAAAMLIGVTRVDATGDAIGGANGGAQGTPAKATITLSPETERGWRAYVAATEARLATELASPIVRSPAERARALAGDTPLAEMETRDAAGRVIDVPDARVSHWRGAILLPGITLDELWTRLRHPNERGPFQPDVLALRVLAREPDELTLFIKMTRTKFVTVTYDSEHRVTFHRDRAHPSHAWTRSEATRITEVSPIAGGGQRELSAEEEHGFLWRLHAYWRYEDLPGVGVLVSLESLTLSRDVPFGLGPLVNPIVDRVARESMTRTLTGVRTEYARPKPASAATPTHPPTHPPTPPLTQTPAQTRNPASTGGARS